MAQTTVSQDGITPSSHYWLAVCGSSPHDPFSLLFKPMPDGLGQRREASREHTHISLCQIHPQVQAQLSQVPYEQLHKSQHPRRCSTLPSHVMQQSDFPAAPSHTRIPSVWDNSNNNGESKGRKAIKLLQLFLSLSRC